MMRGDYDRAIIEHARASSWFELQFDGVWWMYTQTGLALAHLMAGRFQDARAALDVAAAYGRKTSDNGTVSFANAFTAWVYLEQRDWQRALDLASVATELAPTVYFRGFAYGFQAAALCHTGAAAQGLPVLRQIAPAVRASGHELAWIIVAWRLALAEREAGNAEAAASVLADVHASASQSGARFFLGGSERCLAELALDAGDVARATELLESAIGTLRATGSENELALALAARGRARRMLGDEQAAQTDEAAALGIFERLGTVLPSSHSMVGG
jgi:tetratricopeptide (TPR) repeat protein